MTSMAMSLGRRRGSSVQVGAALGVAASLVVLIVLALLASHSSSPSPRVDAARQSALTTWEDTVHPLVASGGEVVALGPRTAVADLTQHTVTDAEMTVRAAGWVRRLTQLDQQISAVDTPAFLRPAHELLGSAMQGYVTASRDLLAAASARGAQRAELLSQAAAAGKAADATYDKAVAAIAALRAQLDLPTDWSG